MIKDIQEISWPGWETVRVLGRGSFGAVYEIQRDVLGEPEKAALKVITIPQSDSEIEELYNDGYDQNSIATTFQSHLKSIVAEYTMMRKLNDCPNVVHCDDIRYEQRSDGIGWDIYIKMELLTPLAKALPEEIPDSLVIKVAKEMCVALEQCGEHNIIHRDIKPQNMFFSGKGICKLGDFGIAKTVERTMGGTKIGTHKYMAPEVYNNQPYGAAADIYSLGLVLYWMLNQRRMPFVPLPPVQVMAGVDGDAANRRLMGEPIPAPKNGSEELKRIVLKACAYNPKDRFASATEMKQALEELSQTPISAPLPPAVEETIRVRKPEAAPERTVRVRQVPDQHIIPSVPAQPISDPAPKKKKVNAKALIAVICALLAVGGIIVAICLIPKSYNSDLFGKVTVGEYITFGAYEQDNYSDNGKENIEWLVLDIQDKKALVISKYALDCQPYHKAAVDVTWETCSLRKWLNEEFIYEAFSAEEQTRIPTVTVLPDEKNTTYSSSASSYDRIPVPKGNATQDKVFLLSADEYDKYYDLDHWMCSPTAYAIAQGTVPNSYDSGNCCWWLRIPGNSQNSAAYIETSGGRNNNCSTNCYSSIANTFIYGIRPMLWISLDSSDTEDPLPENAADVQPDLPDTVSIGDTLTFGTYEQDNSVYTGEEEIEWRVLDVQGSRALVISKYVLDFRVYQYYHTSPVKWENSGLRSWLNHEFVKLAFTDAEKARIPTVTVSTDITNADLSCKTEDRIFLLSADEMATYFHSDTDRIGEATDYAIIRAPKSHDYEETLNSYNRNCIWWLRSHGGYSGYDGSYAQMVSEEGTYMNSIFVNELYGVRPAMWIELDG